MNTKSFKLFVVILVLLGFATNFTYSQEGFPYGKPQVSLCISSFEQVLKSVEKVSTSLRIPIVKDQAVAVLKAWIGTGEESFIDTQRKFAVLSYSTLRFKEKSVVILVPVKETDKLLKRLAVFFNINIEKGVPTFFGPACVKITDKNLFISGNKRLATILNDEVVAEHLAELAVTNEVELQVDVKSFIEQLKKMMPFLQIADTQLENLKRQFKMQGHPEMAPWVDSCKSLAHGLVDGLDKLVVAGKVTDKGLNVSTHVKVLPGSAFSLFLEKTYIGKVALATAFPKNAMLTGGGSVRVTNDIKDFVKGLYQFAHIWLESPMAKMMVPPDGHQLIKELLDIVLFMTENQGNEDALGCYIKEKKLYVVYAVKSNASAEVKARIVSFINHVKEMASKNIPPQLLKQFEGKTLGIVNGQEAKALFSIPVAMLNNMMKRERKLSKILAPAAVKKYFGEYIHIGLFDFPGMIFFGVGGDNLLNELNKVSMDMQSTNAVISHSAFVSYDVKRFFQLALKEGIVTAKRSLKYREEELKRAIKRKSKWSIRWKKRSVERKKREIATLQRLLARFNENVDNVRMTEYYDINGKGIKVCWELNNKVLKQVGDLLIDFIQLKINEEMNN